MTESEMLELADLCFSRFGELPEGPIKVSPFEVITDPAQFVDGHCQFMLANLRKAIVQPYAERLARFFEILEPAPGA